MATGLPLQRTCVLRYRRCRQWYYTFSVCSSMVFCSCTVDFCDFTSSFITAGSEQLWLMQIRGVYQSGPETIDQDSDVQFKLTTSAEKVTGDQERKITEHMGHHQRNMWRTTWPSVILTLQRTAQVFYIREEPRSWNGNHWFVSLSGYSTE